MKPPSQRTTRIGSLFSGYGGLDLGVMEALGGTVAWHAEFEDAPSRILAHHWPDVPNLGDVTAVDWSAVEHVDVICGGSPCQDVSMAGARKGMRAGTRSGLWASMCDAIDIIRPSLVIWENVRGALSAGADSGMGPCDLGMGCEGPVSLRALGRVLGDLTELGYDAGWEVVRASDIGAPHRRERVFVVAHPGGSRGYQAVEHDGRGAAAGDRAGVPHKPDRHAHGTGPERALSLLPTPRAEERMQRNSRDNYVALSIAVTDLLPTPTTSDTNGHGSHGDGGTDLRTTVALLPTPRATDGTKGGPNQRGSSGDLMLPSAVQLLPTPSAADAMGGHERRGGARGGELLLKGIAKYELLPTPTTTQRGPDSRLGDRPNAQANLHNEVTAATFGQYAPAIARWEAVTGRTAPAPTEPNAAGNQRLSARFVEWMQGLPDGWAVDVPGITRNQALKALGNGVVPQQAAHAIRRILAGANG